MNSPYPITTEVREITATPAPIGTGWCPYSWLRYAEVPGWGYWCPLHGFGCFS